MIRLDAKREQRIVRPIPGTAAGATVCSWRNKSGALKSGWSSKTRGRGGGVIIPFDNPATVQPLFGHEGEGVGIPSGNPATVQPLRSGENLDLVGDRIA
jgi:hypothetical protein